MEWVCHALATFGIEGRLCRGNPKFAYTPHTQRKTHRVQFSGFYVGSATRAQDAVNNFIPKDELVVHLDCSEGKSAELDGEEAKAFLASDEFTS